MLPCLIFCTSQAIVACYPVILGCRYDIGVVLPGPLYTLLCDKIIHIAQSPHLAKEIQGGFETCHGVVLIKHYGLVSRGLFYQFTKLFQ